MNEPGESMQVLAATCWQVGWWCGDTTLNWLTFSQRLIQLQIQHYGIDAGFAEEAEFAALGGAGDELFHLGGRDAAGFGYAGDLGFGVGDGDFGIGEGVGGMAPV